MKRAEHDPDDDEELEAAPTALDPVTGRLRVLDALCGTCIAYPDDRMFLEERRVPFMEAARDQDSYVVCHSTGERCGAAPAVCRGFFNRYWRDVASLRFGRGFNAIDYVPVPPEGEFDAGWRARRERDHGGR